MNQPIRLLFPNQHSPGRGIGFYTKNLIKAFKSLDEVKLVSHNPDLIHYPYFDLFYPSLPLFKLNPTVVTIHDVTPLVLADLYPQGIRAKLALAYQKLSLQNVSAVITDSQNSKKDLQAYLNLSADKIHVTPLAVNPIYQKPVSDSQLTDIKQKYQLPDEFVLYVSGVNPNKNLPALIAACHNLDLPLVLVGSEFTKPARQTFSVKEKLGLQNTHPELEQLSFIKKMIKERNSVHALGFVSTPDLSAIYRLATLYCQPSLYEGFGLPVLEAMTTGCLVVSSHTSSLPEIYPDGTLTFDPQNQQQMEQVLKKAFQLPADKKQALIDKASKKAQEFTWQLTAQKTLSVYQQVLNR